ncbi:TylF/MycF/NovP-related O-methyltransferase [Actinokineospora terrae]|uniref:Macrocin-O-methyltransferase (TylF) n=1 Tax=Actinokineospora terrae TaxID=155974 RepID=A0A1H9KUG2_9PSEU|nr:TylF/MycF/NovP-related O-methyltransferase [Actinokineospora terrae]SER02770.1 Macrocin-O-methyltransferase (TylF) [Actinokineospora terrae]
MTSSPTTEAAPPRSATQVTNATYQDLERANKVYGDVFRAAFEYVYGSHIPGDVVEFGCYEGFSSLLLADLIGEFDAQTDFYTAFFPRRIHVYDSFAGFPKSENPVDSISYEVADSGYWREAEDASPPGTEEMLRQEFARRFGDNGWTVVRGMFNDTLASDPLPGEVAIANLDCDLYSSSVEVLDHLLGRRLMPDGAVLLLDDYNCNRANPRFGMRRAMRECFARTDGFYEYSEFLRYGWHGRAFFVHRLGDSPNPDGA